MEKHKHAKRDLNNLFGYEAAESLKQTHGGKIKSLSELFLKVTADQVLADQIFNPVIRNYWINHHVLQNLCFPAR